MIPKLKYFTEDDTNELAENLAKIMVRNNIKPSDQHIIGIIALGDELYYEMNFIRLYNQKSTLRVEKFIDNFNEIFQREGEDFVITFKEQATKGGRKGVKKVEKDWNVNFDDKLVTDWIVKTLRSAITGRHIPIDIGPQLFDAYLTGNTSKKKYSIYQKNIEGTRLEIPVKLTT